MKRHLIHFYENKLPAVDLDAVRSSAGEYPHVADGEKDTVVHAAIRSVEDIAAAREKGQAMAQALGLSVTQRTVVATAISELASNILLYANRGEILIARAEKAGGSGVTVTARDEGPGIPNLQHALSGGYSSSGGLGLGLPGVKHLMDEFEIETSPRGTVVTTTMWR